MNINEVSKIRLDNYKETLMSGYICPNEEEDLQAYWLETTDEWAVVAGEDIIVDVLTERDALVLEDEMRGFIEKARRFTGIDKVYEIYLSNKQDDFFFIEEKNLDKILLSLFDGEMELWEFGVNGIYEYEDAKKVYDMAIENDYIIKESDIKYGRNYNVW